MVNVNVLNVKGEQVGTLDLNENIFGVEVNQNAMHTAVVHYLANQRLGTKSAKTRAEVRGGGRKPWRQKGTGRARQGSIRSPQWTGGGVVFAPKPRDFSFKMNKKLKRLALKSALTTKINDSKFIIIDELVMNEIKTKEMQKVMDNIKVSGALLVIKENDREVYLSSRNLANVKTTSANTINTYDILKYDTFVVTKEAVKIIEEVYA